MIRVHLKPRDKAERVTALVEDVMDAYEPDFVIISGRGVSFYFKELIEEERLNLLDMVEAYEWGGSY
jgi:hypothetical protein